MAGDLRIRLIHDGVEPGPALGEPLRCGLQDRVGEVHPGVAASGGVLHFDFALIVKGDERAGPPVFGGPYAHGTSKDRVLNLGWPRPHDGPAPSGRRIKIPLAGIGWPEIRAAERADRGLAADVRGRRPHLRPPVDWRVENVGSAVTPR